MNENLISYILKINEMINFVNKEAKKDLYRNYKWREFIQEFNIKKYDNTYQLNLEKNTGHDFKNFRTLNGEEKSSNNVKLNKKTGLYNINSCKFEFDKINDDYKIEKMFEVEAYSFGCFFNNNLLFSAYANDVHSVNEINKLLKIKVTKKQEYFKKCKLLNKRPARDSITISGKELLSISNLIWLDNNGKVINIYDFIKV